MLNWMDVMVAQQMREDALVRAERERLIRQAQRDRTAGGYFLARDRYRRWMARLGSRLIAWGQQLETRYTVPGTADAVSGS